MLPIQARLDKEDLRIELSVAALRKETRKAVQKAADMEVTHGRHHTAIKPIFSLH